ncbi:phage holin family protein [Candidatus Protofrankia californiensis]|uniref:phage holin family protein n=1 Tax=Candidatus Protofrankia californiensis TaxID=1839754 RepID=UPI0010418BC9|nr:alkaline phosphatase family protein [Candidatus Protofrankia californiensis]
MVVVRTGAGGTDTGMQARHARPGYGRRRRLAVIGRLLRGRLRLAGIVLRDMKPTPRRLLRVARSVVASGLALGLSLEFLPGVEVNGFDALMRLVVILALVGAVLRPVLVALAVALGGIAVLLIGLFAQTLVIYVALRIEPDVISSSFGAAVGVAWGTAVISAVVGWLADAGSDETFIGEVMRQVARYGGGDGSPFDGPGVVIVQIDGLSAPLLRWAVTAGNLPTLSRWVRSGSHRFVEWHTGMPSTTPTSQAGILHGASSHVPAFRWYDKAAGRLVVTNRPRDAAEIERGFSNGRGLLADGGVSISNVFSGDAPHSLLTVSQAGLPGRRAHGYASFAASPQGLARSLVLTIGEMIKEVHQARKQRRDNIFPRVRRGGSYVALRGLTNVLLRDLNVTFIAAQMARGVPVVFCDFVDYDEVAHHAGPNRRESLQTLEGVDRVLAMLERVAAGVERAYEIVVLSDHGQSQGATFRQRYGQSFEDTVRDLLTPGAAAAAATGTAEDWGPVNTLLTEVTGGRDGTGAGRLMLRRRTDDGQVTFGPSRLEVTLNPQQPDLVVVASGNLAMVYLPQVAGRADLEQMEFLHPALVRGLIDHPGIGFVVVHCPGHGPVAFGARGRMFLETGVVEGTNPLLGYGSRAAADLLRHQRMHNVGDIVVMSRIDPGTREVAAFEELVGCHGGIGGDQTRAVLLYPASWPAAANSIEGPDAVHHQLVRWLERLGLRRDPLPTTRPPAGPDAGLETPPARRGSENPAITEITEAAENAENAIERSVESIEDRPVHTSSKGVT